MLSHFSHVQLFACVAHQAPLSIGSSRQEYWSRSPCSSLGDLPNPGIESESLKSPAFVSKSFVVPWWLNDLKKKKICLQCGKPRFNSWIKEDPLEKGMATHSSILAWRIPMDWGAWWATVHGLQRATKHSRKVLTYLAFLLVSDSIHSYISKERGKGQGNSTTRKIIGKTFPHSSVTSQIRLSHTAKTLNINPPAPHPNETFKSCPSESLINLKC